MLPCPRHAGHCKTCAPVEAPLETWGTALSDKYFDRSNARILGVRPPSTRNAAGYFVPTLEAGVPQGRLLSPPPPRSAPVPRPADSAGPGSDSRELVPFCH